MIVTLTANPALDRTVELPAALVVGDVQAAAAIR
ncbi:MAG: 1-phosphofructokinase, partial [Microbacterium gubbeenense]